jgi:hypothetical protein
MEETYPGLGAHHCHRCVTKSTSHRRQFRDLDNASSTMRLFLVRLQFLHRSEVISQVRSYLSLNIEFPIQVSTERRKVLKIFLCNTWSTDEFVAVECDAVLINEGCVWP